MMCLFADLPLCRGKSPLASRSVLASPDQFAARPDLQFVRARNPSSYKSCCAFAFRDYSRNPLAAAARGVAKFSFKRVLLCCRIVLRLTGEAFRPVADACPLPIFVKAPAS